MDENFVSQVTRLDSGLQVVTASMPWMRGVAVELLVQTGSRVERIGEEGSAHFVEHMLFKGTKKRPFPLDLSSKIEALGGVVNAWTNQECTAIELQGPLAALPEFLDAALDMATQAQFPAQEFELEKQVILEEIRGYMDDPGEACADLLPQALWPNHSLGRPILGTLASVEQICRQQLIEFYLRHYRPENMVLAVVGNVEHGQVVEQLTAINPQWEEAELATASPPWQQGELLCLQQVRADLTQRHVALGWRAPAALDSRRYQAKFASTALAETMSSRLFQRLREELGLVYQVGSEYVAWSDTGAIQLFLEAETEKMTTALACVEEEMQNIADKGFTTLEVESSRGFLLGQLELAFDSPARVCRFLAESVRLQGKVLSLSTARTAYQELQESQLREEISLWLAQGNAKAEVGPR